MVAHVPERRPVPSLQRILDRIVSNNLNKGVGKSLKAFRNKYYKDATTNTSSEAQQALDAIIAMAEGIRKHRPLNLVPDIDTNGLWQTIAQAVVNTKPKTLSDEVKQVANGAAPTDHQILKTAQAGFKHLYRDKDTRERERASQRNRRGGRSKQHARDDAARYIESIIDHIFPKRESKVAKQELVSAFLQPSVNSFVHTIKTVTKQADKFVKHENRLRQRSREREYNREVTSEPRSEQMSDSVPVKVLPEAKRASSIKPDTVDASSNEAELSPNLQQHSSQQPLDDLAYKQQLFYEIMAKRPAFSNPRDLSYLSLISNMILADTRLQTVLFYKSNSYSALMTACHQIESALQYYVNPKDKVVAVAEDRLDLVLGPAVDKGSDDESSTSDRSSDALPYQSVEEISANIGRSGGLLQRMQSILQDPNKLLGEPKQVTRELCKLYKDLHSVAQQRRDYDYEHYYWSRGWFKASRLESILEDGLAQAQTALLQDPVSEVYRFKTLLTEMLPYLDGFSNSMFHTNHRIRQCKAVAEHTRWFLDKPFFKTEPGDEYSSLSIRLEDFKGLDLSTGEFDPSELDYIDAESVIEMEANYWRIMYEQYVMIDRDSTWFWRNIMRWPGQMNTLQGILSHAMNRIEEHAKANFPPLAKRIESYRVDIDHKYRCSDHIERLGLWHYIKVVIHRIGEWLGLVPAMAVRDRSDSVVSQPNYGLVPEAATDANGFSDITDLLSDDASNDGMVAQRMGDSSVPEMKGVKHEVAVNDSKSGDEFDSLVDAAKAGDPSTQLTQIDALKLLQDDPPPRADTTETARAVANGLGSAAPTPPDSPLNHQRQWSFGEQASEVSEESSEIDGAAADSNAGGLVSQTNKAK